MNKIVVFIVFFLGFSELAFAQPNYAAWNAFLKKNVSSSGQVNYAKIKQKPQELTKIMTDFGRFSPQKHWTTDETLAYWINVYNAATIDVIVQYYPIKSIKDIDNGKTWDVKRIKIGTKTFSLNEIENDIIRPQFKEPRIHFALNCGAKSYPVLLNAAYIPLNLSEQLSTQTKLFIASKHNSILKRKAVLSPIFDWYKADFPDIRAFINKYSPVVLDKEATIRFMEYNWELNE